MDYNQTIIILDDEVIAAMGLQVQLRNAGYQNVYIASSYDRAIEMYQSVRPDTAIVDINLQESRTGLDFVREARGLSKVIILTGYGKHLYESELQTVRYDHYIEKPVGPQTVIDSLAN